MLGILEIAWDNLEEREIQWNVSLEGVVLALI
jgi:hypothetical protein